MSQCYRYFWCSLLTVVSLLITVLRGNGALGAGDPTETTDLLQAPGEARRPGDPRAFLGHRDGGHSGV